jgi:hypothetical protein
MISTMIEECTEEIATERLYYWQYHNGDSFSSMLFALLGKADVENRMRLGHAFPAHFKAWLAWYHSENPDQFFRDRGFKV